MRKYTSILTLSLLASCAMADGNTIPIGSTTAPITSQALLNGGDESYKIRSMNQPSTVDEISTVETQAPVMQEQLPEMPQPVDNGTPSEVAKTNFAALGSYKIGNPYLIDGVSYYPHEDYNYSEIGIASWYGPSFSGGKTANGEIFDETKFSAAHRTLPMPSLVRVTNLENGISMTLKVNDRGPYARDRIIDLSSAAADVLRIKEKGTARVRVEILPEESKNLKELAMASQNTDIYEPNISYSSNEIQPEAPKVEEPAPMVQEPAPVVEPVPAPEPTPAPAPEPTPAPAPVANTNGSDFFVQVAAYSTYEKAEALKDKLVNFGTVKIFKSVVNGETLYKVRLGEFATKEEAENVQRQVTDSGIKGSRVILKEDGTFKWNIK